MITGPNLRTVNFVVQILILNTMKSELSFRFKYQGAICIKANLPTLVL